MSTLIREPRPVVIDSHLHIGPWFGFTPPGFEPPLGGQLETLTGVEEFLHKSELYAAIAMIHYAPNLSEHSYQQAHEFLVQALASLDSLYGAVLVSPDYKWTCGDTALKELCESPKVVALKIAPNTWSNASLAPRTWRGDVGRRLEHLIAFSCDAGLPIQTHTGGGNASVSHLEDFVANFGESVDLHCVHMGGRASGHFAFVPLFCEWMLAGKRVYCDFSWARPFGSRWLVRALRAREIPLTNLLLASDEPWGSLSMELTRIRELGLTVYEEEAILSGNALALYLEGSHHANGCQRAGR